MFWFSRLCKEHTEEYEASRLKPKCKVLPPLCTADTILYGLSHYIKHGPYYKKEEKLVGATADELLEQIEKNKNIVVNPFSEFLLYICSNWLTLHYNCVCFQLISTLLKSMLRQMKR